MSPAVQRITDHASHRQVEELETEYFTWVNSELGNEFGISLDVEAMIAHDSANLHIYLPPSGALFLAVEDDEVAGMIFLAQIRPDTAQIRRMYIRETYRRQGLGRALFGAAVDAARDIGYPHLVLESPRSWAGAHAVYRSHGFREVAAYPESEVPTHLQQYWIFLGLDLEPV